MRVIKWEPFRDVDDVFDRFFADAFRRFPRQADESRPALDWAPLADVSETEGEYLIKAELPEVRKEDVNVTASNSPRRNRARRSAVGGRRRVRYTGQRSVRAPAFERKSINRSRPWAARGKRKVFPRSFFPKTRANPSARNSAATRATRQPARRIASAVLGPTA